MRITALLATFALIILLILQMGLFLQMLGSTDIGWYASEEYEQWDAQWAKLARFSSVTSAVGFLLALADLKRNRPRKGERFATLFALWVCGVFSLIWGVLFAASRLLPPPPPPG